MVHGTTTPAPRPPDRRGRRDRGAGGEGDLAGGVVLGVLHEDLPASVGAGPRRRDVAPDGDEHRCVDPLGRTFGGEVGRPGLGRGAEIEQDPFVQAVMKSFPGAEITSVRTLAQPQTPEAAAPPEESEED